MTSGLIEKLSRDELEAVLAAEMWAIRRYDTAMQTVTLGLTAETAAIVIFPTVAVADILRVRLLRNADFGADTLAVATTRHPDALRRAMERLRDDPAVVETVSPSTAPLWFEPLPHGAHWSTEDYASLALTPSLDERLAHLNEQITRP